MAVLDDIAALYGAIVARATGKQVSQAGHKDKQASYSATPLADMISLYRQLWYSGCGYPELDDLGRPAARRGGPFRMHGPI